MTFNIKNLLPVLTAAALSTTLFFTACKKDNVQTPLTDDQKVALAEQGLKANLFFTSSFAQGVNASTKANGLRSEDATLEVRGACNLPTVVPADLFTFPKTVTKDFGAGCTDIDGKTKSGKMILKVGKVWETGSTIQVTFENYTEDGNKLDGTYSMINNSTFGVTNLTFVAENIKITDKDGKTVTYTLRQTHKQVGGTLNFDFFDDVYEISTQMSSTLPDGTSYSWSNTTPLKKTNICWWIQKGTGKIKLGDTEMGIDFGNDTCDNEATITVGGVTRIIKL
jgi:hypothetical protein